MYDSNLSIVCSLGYHSLHIHLSSLTGLWAHGSWGRDVFSMFPVQRTMPGTKQVCRECGLSAWLHRWVEELTRKQINTQTFIVVLFRDKHTVWIRVKQLGMMRPCCKYAYLLQHFFKGKLNLYCLLLVFNHTAKVFCYPRLQNSQSPQKWDKWITFSELNCFSPFQIFLLRYLERLLLSRRIISGFREENNFEVIDKDTVVICVNIGFLLKRPTT